jgi:hypothetical protein
MQRFTFSPLEVEDSCEYKIYIRSHFFQKDLGVQRCHQLMSFMINIFLMEKNS